MVALQRFALICALAVSTVSAFSIQGRSQHLNHARSVQGRSNMVMADTGLHKRAARRCATSSPGSAPSRTPSPTSSVSPPTPTVVDSSSSLSPSPTPTPESDELINSSSQSSSSTSSSDFVPPPSPSPSSSEPAPTSSSDPVPSPSPTPDPSPSSSAGPEQALTTPDSSSSTPPPPPPTPTPEPPKNDNPPPPPPPPSGGGDDKFGQITFYSTGMGACGWVSHDSDFIAAASIPMFDGFPGANGNPNQNPICGKQASITSGGKTITVTIVDRCEGCARDDLDLSPSAFNALHDFGVGRTAFSWHFL